MNFNASFSAVLPDPGAGRSQAQLLSVYASKRHTRPRSSFWSSTPRSRRPGYCDFATAAALSGMALWGECRSDHFRGRRVKGGQAVQGTIRSGGEADGRVPQESVPVEAAPAQPQIFSIRTLLFAKNSGRKIPPLMP
jgi:hypothetical protein